MAPNDFIESGNYTGLIILGIFALVTGGMGAAVVNAIAASRRGIKGDALQKDANAVEGFGALAEALQKDNQSLRERLDNFEKETAARIQELEAEVVELLGYNNLLIHTLNENTIEIPPRPVRKKRYGN